MGNTYQQVRRSTQLKGKDQDVQWGPKTGESGVIRKRVELQYCSQALEGLRFRKRAEWTTFQDGGSMALECFQEEGACAEGRE